jgi:anti-sigma regulatory factor (Ser/Thr protein kinase)
VHAAAGAVPSAGAGLDVDAWAQDVLALTRSVTGVHRAALALAEGGGRRLRFTASDRANDAGVDWCHIDAYDDVPLNTAIRTGKPVLESLDQLGEKYADFVESQRTTTTIAVAAVPIVMDGQTVGGFVLFFDLAQDFDPQQQSELERVGRHAGARLLRTQRAAAGPLMDGSDEPVIPGATVAVHAVPPDPAGVSKAREFLRRTLKDWGINEDTTDTAVLCLSELVTNAVIHTQAGCVVRVLLEDGALTTTVRDGGSPNAAATAPVSDPLQTHGRGLHLVDALANRWGSELDNRGTTVWFVLQP